MEQRRGEPDEFNLGEWSVKARLVSRENTSSRRFSASNLIRSFREEQTNKSFRSNFTISSTASSPGYTLRDEIDPTTYSFTTALRALQARSGYSWEITSSPDGFALNSKWSDAEKYICNPLSGQVPVECLSAKTLSGRYFPSLAGRVTMSAPLIYQSSYSSRPTHPKSTLPILESDINAHFPITEKNMGKKTRDVGTQSTPRDLSTSSSSSPSPAHFPSIEDRSIQRSEIEVEDCSPFSDVAKHKFKDTVQSMHVEVKEPEEIQEISKRNEENIHDDDDDDDGAHKKDKKQMWKCKQAGGCCISWRSLWMRSKRGKRENKHTISSRKKNVCIHHISSC